MSTARQNVWQYYRLATFSTVIIYGLVAVYAGATHNWNGLLTVALLAALEISLSFDNAIVNAKYLRRLSPEWQKAFLTYGILIAVVGMRLLFPIIVVSLSALISPFRAAGMAFTDPHAYAATLEHAHTPLVVFGGTYLLQVSLGFFLNTKEKDATWLSWLERPLEWIGDRTQRSDVVASGSAAVAVGALGCAWSSQLTAVLIAGGSSLVLFQVVSFIGGRLEDKAGDNELDNKASTKIQLGKLTGRAAASTFIYLEVQDAMFSFDGVLGAFAFTVLIALIMAGLGIGALYVRAMTLHLVRAGALEKLRYLGNGAFWAIGVLPFSMWLEWPDYITGGVSVSLIAAALGHSLIANRRELTTTSR